MIGRLVSTLTVEWHLERRAGVPLIVLALVGAWLLVSALVPSSWRSPTVALGLFVDLAGVSLLVVPALVVGERTGGTDRVLQLTLQPPIERMVVRVMMSTVLGAAGAALLVAVSGVDGMPSRLAGIVAMASFFGFASGAILGRARTLTTYMTRLPAVAAPLILPALLHHVGLWDSTLAWLSPVTAQMALLSGDSIGWAAWVAQAVWVTLAIGASTRATGHDAARTTTDGAGGLSRRPPAAGPLRRLRSLLWVDRSVLLGDPLTVMVLVGAPATALAARLAITVGAEWVPDRFGIPPEDWAPLVVGLLVVVHTPVLIGSVAGLLMLEDRDAGMWPLVATTSLGLGGLVLYRCGLAVVATTSLTAAGLVVTGVGHAAGAAGVAWTALAAGLAAPIPTLLMTALSRDRTTGVGVMKLLGVPFYLPLALWWIEGALIPLSLVPTTWALTAFWSETVPGALVGVGAAAVSASAAGTLLWLRLRRRVT